MRSISLKNQSSLSVYYVSALILALGVFFYHLMHIVDLPVSVDAGSYLLKMRAINAGKEYNLNVCISHTPLVFFLGAVWLRLFGDSFTSIMGFVYLFHMANILVLALILLAHKAPATLTALLCAASFGMVMRFGANGLLLEPFVVFFVELTYLVRLRLEPSAWRAVVMGLLLGLALFAKQHAAFMIIGFLVLEAWEGWRRPAGTAWRLFLLAGCAALPLLAHVLVASDGPLARLQLYGFLGGGAVQYIQEVTEENYFKELLFRLVKSYWLTVPLLAACWLACRQRFTETFFRTCVVLALTSGLSLYVKLYHHYFQYFVPFACVAWALLYREYASRLDDRTMGLLVRSALAAFAGAFLPVAGAMAVAPDGGGKLLTTAVLLLFALQLLFLAWRGLLRLEKEVWAAALALALILFPTSESFRTPYAQRAADKVEQQRMAEATARVFPGGSRALIVGDPALNVVCDVEVPMIYSLYAFRPTLCDDWTAIPRVLVTHLEDHAWLLAKLAELGFERVDDPSVKAAFFIIPRVYGASGRLRWGRPCRSRPAKGW